MKYYIVADKKNELFIIYSQNPPYLKDREWRWDGLGVTTHMGEIGSMSLYVLVGRFSVTIDDGYFPVDFDILNKFFQERKAEDNSFKIRKDVY